MKRLYRITGIFAVLLTFASAHAQICEKEFFATKSSQYAQNVLFENLEQHRNLIATKKLPKANNGKDVGKYFFSWFSIVGPTGRIELSLSEVTIEGEENLRNFLTDYLRKNTSPQSHIDEVARSKQRAYVVNTAIPNIEYQNCIAAYILAENTKSTSADTILKNITDNQSQKQFAESNERQQQSQQAQQTAQQNQSRADQQRQGLRKTNDPAAQASNCLEIDKDAALYGGFKNTCEYKVNYVFCNFGPKKDSWAGFHNCESKHGIGADGVGPRRASAAHTKNTAMVYWFACKAPSFPVDAEFVLGKGIEARCHN